MVAKQMHARRAQVLVARRYLERGFLDVALRLFERNAALVEKRDWRQLADRLVERSRILDVVRVCELGGIALPYGHLVGLGDDAVSRRDFESAIRFYELGNAERERWAQLVDLLTATPSQQQRAIALTERHLVREQPAPQTRVAVAG